MAFADPIIRQNSQCIDTMNVNTILNNTLSLFTLNMHKIRFQALAACVHRLLHGDAASVTSMGRGIDSKSYEKHNIKRADKLCSNPHLPLLIGSFPDRIAQQLPVQGYRRSAEFAGDALWPNLHSPF